MLDLAIIADDITGAADTGVQFLPVFAPVYLLDHRSLSLEGLEPPPRALSVFTNSRGLSPAEAGRVVLETGRAVRARGPQRAYKKIDSALRGHIGAELEAVMEALDLPFSLIAPAFPAQGRSTVGGVHRIHGVPVAESEMGRDPVCPVTESSLPERIRSQARFGVGHVDRATVEDGVEAIAACVERLRAAGVRHITFDADRPLHLERIAELALSRYPEGLLCGSAGLAQGLVRRLPPRAVDADPQEGRRGRRAGGFLFVCGSASRALRAQTAVLAEQSGVAVETLTPAALLGEAGDEAASAQLSRAVDALSQGDLLVRVSPSAGGPPVADPQRLVSRLADFAAALMKHAPTAGLFLSGGDTAVAVLDRLQVRAVRLEKELASGLVGGVLAGGPWSGGAVVTKAGSFGGPETLLDLYRIWRPR